MATKKALKSYPIYDWQSQESPVIGVDEAGRGCLAGPVCSGAVILPPSMDAKQFTDSKLLSAKRRSELFDVLMSEAQVGVGYATVEEITEINILQASLLSMKRAVEALKTSGGTLLVDGTFKIPNCDRKQITLVKGDLRAAPVAAASIIAKVSRDRLMDLMDEDYPGYGFKKHKGYATAIHRKAIATLGPLESVHRDTFAGVKEHLR